MARVEATGGVRVFPSSGGVFPASESVPSGLAGYAGSDVIFRQVPDGVLETRPDGVVGARAYAFELHELGGVVTYFNAVGDPIAQIAANGDRSEWVWADDVPHRLSSVVSVDGVVTELDWSDPAGVVVRPGVNVPAEGGGAGMWRVRMTAGRVAEVTDPVGGRSRVGYDRAGRVDRVVSGSGATTTVEWRTDSDGVSRVDRVGVAGPTGAELSSRSWRQVDGVLPTGWPVVDPAGAEVGSVGGSRSVEVSDGKTRVVSEFDAWNRPAGKQVVVSSSAGEYVIQEQEFIYPEEALLGTGGAAGKPVAAEVRFRDAAGGVRAGTESYERDELGRMVRRVSADGTVLERGYDAQIPEGRLLPVGMVTAERSTAPDGSVTFTDTGLDASRTIPVLVEQGMQVPGADPVVTGRIEYRVEDGAVAEERVFPGGDAAAVPVVTRWDEQVDLSRGVRTVTETVAAGTELAVTSSSVASLLHGGALESTDVLGHTSTATYDDAGRPVSATDAAGRVVTTAYVQRGDGGDEVTVTGPDGVAITEVRDVLGRLVQKHDNLNPDGAPAQGEVRVFATHTFPAPGVEETTDAWGATTRIELDVHGRPLRTTLPNGLVQVTAYDDVAATVTSGTTPTGRLADAEQTSTSRMDTSGRVTSTEGARADGAPVPATSVVYDGFGRQVQTANGSASIAVEYDAKGNPATTTISPVDPATDAAADLLVAQRRFDASGTSLEKTVSAGGQERSGGSRELDLLGRTVTETDQAGAVTRYEYTPDGLPSRVVTSAGQVTTYEYDDTTRAVIQVRVEAPGQRTVVTGFAYEETTGRVTGVFDPADRVGTEITYTYDGFGNTRTVQYPAEDAGGPGGKVEHEYDRHGRKVATTDVAGNQSVFEYAADGFLTGAVQTRADGVELARVQYRPDEYGRVQQITYGNGVMTSYEFTSTGQVSTETTTGPGGAVQSERKYSYDSVTGNLTSRVDRTAGEASADRTAERREYTYDHLGRLTGSTIREGEAPDAKVASRVDYEITVSGQVGRETSTEGASGAVTTREFAYSPIGALDAITTTGSDGAVRVDHRAHDAAGNLTRAADGTTFEWDAANRQTAQIQPDGTRIDTTYWADGTRKALAGKTGTTTFHWDGDTLINDTHAGTPGQDGVASYLIGASRHARTTHAETAATQYYSTDRHGNVTELTDQAGAIAGTYEYSDYGVASASASIVEHAAPGLVGYNPFQYAGEYTHGDGTQFLSERTYDPTLLNFTSRDREALHDQYGYTDANPIMHVDPSGRLSIKDGFALFMNGLGVVGGLVGAAFAVGSAFSGGGLGLMMFGVVAAGFGVGDAVFSGVEIAGIITEQRFVSEDVALGIGAGLAVGGGLFAGAGKLLSRTAGRGMPAELNAVAPKSLAPVKKQGDDLLTRRTVEVDDPPPSLIDEPNPGLEPSTTGMSSNLTPEQKIALAPRFVRYLHKKVPVVQKKIADFLRIGPDERLTPHEVLVEAAYILNLKAFSASLTDSNFASLALSDGVGRLMQSLGDDFWQSAADAVRRSQSRETTVLEYLDEGMKRLGDAKLELDTLKKAASGLTSAEGQAFRAALGVVGETLDTFRPRY